MNREQIELENILKATDTETDMEEKQPTIAQVASMIVEDGETGAMLKLESCEILARDVVGLQIDRHYPLTSTPKMDNETKQVRELETNHS